MDIDLLSKIVKEIILDKDEVSLPGLGSFIAELVPSVFSDKGYTINPPYKRLYFRQKENPQDTSLIDFYASSNKIEKQIASDIVCDFLRELRKVLEVKKTIIFPGLGRLRATKENYFFFVADENLDIYPEGFGLEPISLKTHEETTSEVSNTMATLRAILSPEEDANEPAQVKVNAEVKVNADVSAGGVAEDSHTAEAAENVTAETTKSTTGDVTTEAVATNTEGVTTNGSTSERTGKATAETASIDTIGVNGTEIAEAAGNSTTNGNGHINGTMSEDVATDVTDGAAEVVTGVSATGAVENANEKVFENAAANVTEKASENTNESAAEVATDGAAEVVTGVAATGVVANAKEEAFENAAANMTEKASENVTETATYSATESLTETMAEAGDQTKPAESETTALAKTLATGKKKSIRKTIGWTIIVLAALTLTALAAFMILAHTAPDFIDSILYTPEELEIINR